MAAGDVTGGVFSIQRTSGALPLNNVLGGGTTYYYVRIQAHTPLLVGNSTIDSGNPAFNWQRLKPGDVIELKNESAVAGLIDGAKIHLRGHDNDPKASKCDIIAIANV